MILRHLQYGPKLLAFSAVGVAFCCSACATVPQTVRSNSPESGAFQAIYTETTPGTANVKSARKGRPATSSPATPVVPSSGAHQIYRDPAIQQIGYSDGYVPPNASLSATNGQTAEFVPENQSVQIAANSIECCPAEPRFPAAGVNPMAPGMMAYDVSNLPSTENYSDEYLCDGGDRDLPVHYDSYSRRSLDTEDTILEFTDRSGRERMKPSNRVCIYAPRFASVRTVSRPHEDLSTNEAAGLGQMASTSGVHARLKLAHEVKLDSTSRLSVRSRASGLDMDSAQGAVTQLHTLSVHDKLLNLYQALSFVRSGRIDDSDSARLNYGIQAAFEWTREEYPVIAAKTDVPVEGHFEQSVAAITCIDEKEEAENLRIVKLADKSTAASGDTIEFTIRYDNLGGREVHHIRIVDNLTPRLAYIDESATSDRAGRLVLQDNGEGSQILIWEMDEPLPGKTGGVVTFKVRVR